MQWGVAIEIERAIKKSARFCLRAVECAAAVRELVHVRAEHDDIGGTIDSGRSPPYHPSSGRSPPVTPAGNARSFPPRILPKEASRPPTDRSAAAAFHALLAPDLSENFRHPEYAYSSAHLWADLP